MDSVNEGSFRLPAALRRLRARRALRAAFAVELASYAGDELRSMAEQGQR